MSSVKSHGVCRFSAKPAARKPSWILGSSGTEAAREAWVAAFESVDIRRSTSALLRFNAAMSER